ncbi:hypothetical protein EVG20_g2375 [Dentipellis fragilis]|uniref:Uncharacterized protein n=1 Tax=Dentipellis fragilis TaxID=205917 RepID=A0A4Y9Z937_9AGAM|nr:hypothetical protein EVG20_g2375 [Dentipellis fragilis]
MTQPAPPLFPLSPLAKSQTKFVLQVHPLHDLHTNDHFPCRPGSQISRYRPPFSAQPDPPTVHAVPRGLTSNAADIQICPAPPTLPSRPPRHSASRGQAGAGASTTQVSAFSVLPHAVRETELRRRQCDWEPLEVKPAVSESIGDVIRAASSRTDVRPIADRGTRRGPEHQ